jgi:hypothetical protein
LAGGRGDAFQAIESEFEEWGLEASYSAYAGVSGGIKVEGGVGIVNVELASFEYSVLAGYSFHSKVNSSTEQRNSLQIEVDLSKVGSVTGSYEVRLYLLPANPLWARELALFAEDKRQLQQDFDLARSAPFRIFYRVVLNA